jgi:hypothetical protein
MRALAKLDRPLHGKRQKALLGSFALALLRCLGKERRWLVFDFATTALRTLQFGSFVLGNVLGMLEHLAALGAAVLIGGHGSLLHVSGGTESYNGLGRKGSGNFQRQK